MTKNTYVSIKDHYIQQPINVDGNVVWEKRFVPAGYEIQLDQINYNRIVDTNFQCVQHFRLKINENE